MTRFLPLLLKMVRLSQSVGDSPLTPAPIERMAEELLVDIVPPAWLQKLISLLKRVEHIEHSCIPLLQGIAAIEQEVLPAESMPTEQLQRAHLLLDTLLALHCAAISGGAMALTLPIEGNLFRLIQQFRVEPAAGEPEVFLVGSATPLEITVNPSGTSFIEQKTQISYNGQQTHPRLTVKAEAQRLYSDTRKPRENYLQHHSLEWDLYVYTTTDRHVGIIRTRYLELPYTISGLHYTLTFPAGASVRLLATCICDPKERILVQSIRVISQ